MNMKTWLQELARAEVKKAMPILSFPAIQLMGIGVKELILSSDLQAKGMALVAARTNAAAAVSMMDLSVEAECFGSAIRVSSDEVPTVVGSIVDGMASAQALQVPKLGQGRTALYIEAIQKAVTLIPDRPVFAGVIGPFSLAGRLLDVSEAMYYCYDEPELVHLVLKKASDFIIAYCNAYKATGAGGVMIAEPLAGLLSPALHDEFSAPYVKRIVDEVQTDDFLVLYHNCGNATLQLIEGILSIGASAYHFGNAIDMEAMVGKVPSDTIVMGNIDPASQFRNGTPQSIRQATLDTLQRCATHKNFIISSGCDIPPLSPWENIDAFFAAVDEFYQR